MKVFRTLAELAATNRPVSLAIGVFDGVHLGHQRVITAARDRARPAGGQAVALTFDPHPLAVLQPAHAPPLLTATPHKLALFAELGLDAVVLLHFDATVAGIPAADFVAQIAFCRHICVGTRFHFGHDRAGTPALLAELAPRAGFTVTALNPVCTPAGELISSTAIRQHIGAGHLDQAAAMLGRPVAIRGTVIHGAGLGRQLGFPTANLAAPHAACPPDGVYLTRVTGAGAAGLTGVINIGWRPTFADQPPHRTLEVHLLDYNRDIYGAELEVRFVRKLRDEQKFPDVTALKAQIAADIAAARQLAPA